MSEVNSVTAGLGANYQAAPAVQGAPHVARKSITRQEVKIDANADEMVKELNSMAEEQHLNLDFSVHKETGRTMIRVVDSETDKVVREFPPKDLLDIQAALQDLAGSLLNATA